MAPSAPSTLTEWEFFHLLEGYLSDSLDLRVAQVGEKLPSNCPRQAVKFVGQNYARIFDAKQQTQLSFTNAAFHTINNVLNAMHHRIEMQWQNAEDCYNYALRVLRDLERLYNIKTADMVNDLELKWPQVAKADVAFAHQNRLMVVTKTALRAFPFEQTKNEKSVMFSIAVPESLLEAPNDIVEHLREVEEIAIVSNDTSQKGVILCSVADEKDIASILPEFLYRRQKLPVKLVHSFSVTLYPLHESKTSENVRMALKGMDVVPVCIHEPDRTEQTIVVDVASQEDLDYIKEQGVSMKPQKLNVRETPQSIPYVVYLAAPIKSHDAFKIVWENHFQFIPDVIHFSNDLCSVAFEVEDRNNSNILSKAKSFRLNGTKPVVVPYTPYRTKMAFSSPMEREHLITVLREVSSSPFDLHVPDFDDENSSTFFTAFVHHTDKGVHNTFLASDTIVPPFVPQSTSVPLYPPAFSPPASFSPTPASPAKKKSVPSGPSQIPPSSPQGKGPASLCFSLVAASGMLAPDVFAAFKAVGEEKGAGKGAWNILFVFDRDGIFYVDVWGDPSLVEEIKSVLIGGQQVPVQVVGEAPYYLLQINNVPAAIDKGKILNYFKNEKRRVGQIHINKGVALVPMAQSDVQAYVKKKNIYIDNISLSVSEAGGRSNKPTQQNQIRKTVPIKVIEGTFLKQNKEALIEIENTYSVKIHCSISRGQTSIAAKPGKPKEKGQEQGKGKGNNKGKEKEKGKEKMPKLNKPQETQTATFTVLGAAEENVEQAVGEVEGLLAPNVLKNVGLPFKDSALLNFVLPKLTETLREFDNFGIVYDLKSEKNKISLILFGPQMTVEEVAAHILGFQREFVINDSLKISPTANLDLKSIEAEYDVKLNLNKQTGKLQIIGSKATITQLMDEITAKINKTACFAQVKFGMEAFLWMQTFILADAKWNEGIKKLGAEVIQGTNSTLTVKAKDSKVVQSVKQKLENTRQFITERKVVKISSKYLVDSLHSFVSSQLNEAVVVCKPIGAKTNDDSDDPDDTSSESSFSSASSKNKKTNSSTINVEVGVWYLKSQDSKVAQLLESISKKEPEVMKVKYEPADAAIIKGLNLVALQTKHKVNIYNNIREKSLVIKGFSKPHVQEAYDIIKPLLDRSGSKVVNVTISHHLYNFLKFCRKALFQELKQKHNLKRLELAVTASSATEQKGRTKEIFNVVIEGAPASVTAAQVDLRAVQVKHIKVNGTEDKLQPLQAELRKIYDVSVFIVKSANNAVLTITGEEKMAQWKEIETKVKALKGGKPEGKAPKAPKTTTKAGKTEPESEGFSFSFKVDTESINMLVNSTLKQKTVDLAEFKRRHNLLKKPFINKRAATVTITFATQDEIQTQAFDIVQELLALASQAQDASNDSDSDSSEDDFGMDNDLFTSYQAPFSGYQQPIHHFASPYNQFMTGGPVLRTHHMQQTHFPAQPRQSTSLLEDIFNLLS